MIPKRPWLLTLFVSILCVCFLSVPAFADGGDEDPWDADDGNGGTNGGDLGNGDDGGVTGFLKDADLTDPSNGGIFSNLFWSISAQLYDYFYGSNLVSSQSVGDAKERKSGVDWLSGANRSAR